MNLAISVIDDIMFHEVKRIFLITNDGDFSPLICFIKKRFPKTEIILLNLQIPNLQHIL